jgi:hypothetical protein
MLCVCFSSALLRADCRVCCACACSPLCRVSCVCAPPLRHARLLAALHLFVRDSRLFVMCGLCGRPVSMVRVRDTVPCWYLVRLSTECSCDSLSLTVPRRCRTRGADRCRTDARDGDAGRIDRLCHAADSRATPSRGPSRSRTRQSPSHATYQRGYQTYCTSDTHLGTLGLLIQNAYHGTYL